MPREVEDQAEADQLLAAAVRAADAKLAKEIVILDVAELLSVVDYFIICSGRNTRQVATVVEEVEAGIRRVSGRSPLRIEGLKDATWVLMDYGDLVVHVFLDETREYYDLEHLWAGTPRVSTAAFLDAAGAESG